MRNGYCGAGGVKPQHFRKRRNARWQTRGSNAGNISAKKFCRRCCERFLFEKCACDSGSKIGTAPSAKRAGRRKVRGWVPAVRKARGQSRLRIKKRISAGCRFISPPGHAERAPAAAKGMRQTPGAKFQPFPFILHTSGPDAVRTIPQRRRSLVFQTYVKKSSSGAGGQ